MRYAPDPAHTAEPAHNAHARRHHHPRKIGTVSYCPAHDPILAAGIIQCPRCKAIAFPTDAEWMDHAHILAAFPKPCGHVRGGDFLFDATQPATREPVADPSRYLAGRRCAGHRTDGKPCRAYATPGADYCTHHASQAGG